MERRSWGGRAGTLTQLRKPNRGQRGQADTEKHPADQAVCTRSTAAPRQAGSGPRCRSWDSRGGCAPWGSGGSARSCARRHNVWPCSRGGWGSSPDTLDLAPQCSLQTVAAQRSSATLSAFCPYHQQQRGCQGSTTAARHAAAPALGCVSRSHHLLPNCPGREMLSPVLSMLRCPEEHPCREPTRSLQRGCPHPERCGRPGGLAQLCCQPASPVPRGVTGTAAELQHPGAAGTVQAHRPGPGQHHRAPPGRPHSLHLQDQPQHTEDPAAAASGSFRWLWLPEDTGRAARHRIRAAACHSSNPLRSQHCSQGTHFPVCLELSFT